LGPYVGFLLIWLFAYALFYVTLYDYSLLLSMALLAGFFLYVAVMTARAQLGHKLFDWQKGLVRLPLLMAGGSRTPVEEMKHTGRGRLAVLMSMMLLGAAVAAFVWVIR
jgi:hypothetical protein